MKSKVALIVFVFAGVSVAQSRPPVTQSSEVSKRFERLVGRADFVLLPERLYGLDQDIIHRGLYDVPATPGKMLTGYDNGEFFDWDLYFDSLYLSYYHPKYDVANLKVFLDRQQSDGFISRTIGIAFRKPTQMFKPFMAQTAVLMSKQNPGGYQWLQGNYYARLQKYLDRWFAYDSDHNGLPVWDSSDASGMDNQISRAGGIGSLEDEGVDLACYLVRELRAMAVIAHALGKDADEAIYRQHADRLAALANKVFWDEKDGFYYDRNEKTGKQIHVKSVAGFIPLWAGIASPRQAKRLIHEHLLNKQEFWLDYPVATYAKSEPDFYEGRYQHECNWRGTSWIPTNYMIFHGLMAYGFRNEAKVLAKKTFHMALVLNPYTREYYDSDSGKGVGRGPFWGWSSLAYLMPLDFVANYDPTDLSARTKHPLEEELGIHF